MTSEYFPTAPLVLVTCYYRLSDYDSHYTHCHPKKTWYRSHEQYMTFGADVMNLYIPKIVFVDPNLVDEFASRYISILNDVTKVIGLSFTDLPLFRYMNEWQERYLGGSLTNDKYSGGYYVLVHSKPFFMERAMEMCGNETTVFAFIDFGLSYISPFPDSFVSDMYAMAGCVENSLYVTLLEYEPLETDEIHIHTHLKKVCTNPKHELSAQIWMASRGVMRKYCRRITGFQEWMCESGFLCLEEKLLYLALFGEMDKKGFHHSPLEIRPRLGTYTHVLWNWRRPCRSLSQVVHHVKNALCRGDLERFQQVAEYLLDGLCTHPTLFHDAHLFWDVCVILTWGLYTVSDISLKSKVFLILSVLARVSFVVEQPSVWTQICHNFRFYLQWAKDRLPFEIV